ncbi:MAG: sugar phosphate isomerase/epimerase [Anaerolineaceae bacterium]|nr:MAG: sugar phosphate isomerase/epimerase [Anaerolineaceae bacterium]
MRIGGEIKKPYHNPKEWLLRVKELNYSAVHAPIGHDASYEDKKAYMECARANNILIGEVGVWRNPISLNDEEARSNLEYCKERLALADELGANCCVNIVGSRGEIWDGFYKENYDEDVYTLIVDTTRDIIDSVDPKHTFYTLEPMPWMVPDSPDSYLKLIKDIDRKAFGVHLDFTNMINSPIRFLRSEEFIEECFNKLGPYTKSIHAKDVIMEKAFPCVIKEVMPGKGKLHYQKIVRLIDKLGEDIPVFVEHLDTHEEYKEASSFIRGVAISEEITVI